VSRDLPVPETVPTDPEQLAAILKRAENGDASALPALRQALQLPELVDLCGGNLAREVEHSLIKTAAGKNLAFREALQRKLEMLRAELAGPSPTPVERLLVERVVTCWLHLHDTEVRFVQAKDLTIHQADYRQRALDSCQRRYLAALKALALMRKLALPALQVNIAKKQVNVSG
jgi:hypothetical protein